MAPDLDIRDLRFTYFPGAPNALDGISLSVPPGSVLAVLGPSDAGKSTLLQILSGITGTHLRSGKAGGSVRIGADTFDPLPSRVLFPSAALALQDPRLQLSGVCETVFDEVAFSLNNLGLAQELVTQRTRQVLGQFGLSGLALRDPLSLSGGELQRVVLASLLVVDPPLLLLDEPGNALDAMMTHRLAHFLRSLRGRRTVVFTDYQIDLALAVADVFAVLEHGQVRFQGNRSAFLGTLPALSDLFPVEAWSDLAVSAKTLTAGRGSLRPSLTRLLTLR